MVEINDNRDIDRQEERSLDRKKTEAKHELERKQREEPMRTFEAKLAEKTAHEVNTKDSALYQAKQQGKSKEEKQSLLDKIISVSQDVTGEEDHARLAQLNKRGEEENFDKKEHRADDHEFEDKKTEDHEFTQAEQKKDSGQAADGHKRVTERYQDQGNSGGSGGGAGQNSQQGGSSFGGQSSDSGTDQGGKRTFLSANSRVQGIAKSGAGGGFNKGARNFSKQNLDEIVKTVQLGFNDKGEQEFSVELGDDYFNGLKVVATRSAEGVILKFVCPNVDVRSTFLKFRPNVYAHFKVNSVAVHRIDVV